MKPQDFITENEFIGNDAHEMHKSHQHHMLREECYHSAVNAIKLHKLIGELADGHDLDAWAAEKISLANDYLKTVAEWLEYEVMGSERPDSGGMTAFNLAEAEEKFAELLAESDEERAYTCVHVKKGKCDVTAKTSYEATRKAAAKWKLKTTAGIDAHLKDVEHRAVNEGVAEGTNDSPVAGAITRRILMQRHDLLKQYGPELVTAAIDNVADYVGDVDEIGSSDVSSWVKQVERMLNDHPPEAFGLGKEGMAEGAQDELYQELQDRYNELAPSIEKYKDKVGAERLYNELSAIAKQHGLVSQFRNMCNGARNSAHLDYDTNPGGFENWFWYLPFARDLAEERTETKNDQGEVTSWQDESDWEPVDPKKNPIGKVHNITGQALKKTKELPTLDQDLDKIAENFSSSISTVFNPGSGPKTGSLFGGTYKNPSSPFAEKKRSSKKSSVIKR